MSPPLSKITLLSTNDLDECYFFIDYLDRKNIIRKSRFRRFDGPADICSYLNSSLKKFFRDTPEKVNDVVSDLLYLLSKRIPPEEEAAWLKKDKRACFWLWTELHCLDRDGMPFDKIKGYVPHSHQERHREVMQKYKEFHLDDESRRWSKMVSKWNEIKEGDSLVGCLSPDDENVISYAWKYLCSHGHYIEQKYSPVDNEER